jgi:hypothetical protein
MRRRRGQDQIPWYVWLAVGIDPLTATFLVAAQHQASDTSQGEQR